jgi:hypothetical protein
MSFKTLLRRWETRPEVPKAEQQFSVRLPLEDAARVLALAEMYHLGEEEVITDLLHAALEEIIEAMPYVPGDKVIREDDHGDPIYEDQGPMPKFLELTRARHAALAGSKD